MRFFLPNSPPCYSERQFADTNLSVIQRSGQVRYIESNLLPDKKIIYRARLHWIIFWKSCALVILGGIFLLIQPIIGGVVILIGLFALLFPLIDYATSEFGVTNKRVIIKVRVSAPKNIGVVAPPRGSDIGGPKRYGQVAKLRLRDAHGNRRRERSVS